MVDSPEEICRYKSAPVIRKAKTVDASVILQASAEVAHAEKRRARSKTEGGLELESRRAVVFHDPLSLLKELRDEAKQQETRHAEVRGVSLLRSRAYSHGSVSSHSSVGVLAARHSDGVTVGATEGASLTINETVRVAIRIRPFLQRDKPLEQDILQVSSDGTRLWLREDADASSVECLSQTKRASIMSEASSPFLAPSNTGLDGSRSSRTSQAPVVARLSHSSRSAPSHSRSQAPVRSGRTYAFDYIFDSRKSAASPATQAIVHRVIGENVVKEAMEGYNACLFAYGQTGSGKTHTVMGHSQSQESRGLLPRLLEGIFAAAADLGQHETTSVKISFIEIYNEIIQDLLVTPQKRRGQSLSVRYTPNLGVVISDLSESVASSLEEALEILNFGMKMRSIAATSMNSRSSRAHTIFSLRLEQTTAAGNARIAQVQIVDLAGREQEKKSGDDRDRLRERTFINKSLFHLSTCISNLAKNSRRKTDWTFRNSKLTLVLAHSLGRNSRNWMLGAVSPSVGDMEETLSTLRFASEVKLIKIEATCNTVNKRDLVAELQAEIARLKEQQKTTRCPNRVLQDQVTDLLALCDQYRESFEQEQLVSQKLAEERRQALEELGLASAPASLADAGLNLPYLVNLSEDPFLEGCLMYVLRQGQGTSVGSGDDNHIQLCGLGVAANHCTILHDNDNRIILRVTCCEEAAIAAQVDVNGAEAAGGGATAEGDAAASRRTAASVLSLNWPRTLVNGRRVMGTTVELCHQDRLILGHAFVFRLVVPSTAHTRLISVGSGGDSFEEGVEEALAEVNDPSCAAVQMLSGLCANLPREVRDKLVQDVNFAAGLVDEADLIVQHVRPEEGLKFRLQVVMDILSASYASSAGIPELVVGVHAPAEQSTSSSGGIGNGTRKQKETLRFVWSFEKFQSRLQVMRDVYDESQQYGLEVVRRRLRHEPYCDPWKEIGNGEVQLLLQGLRQEDELPARGNSPGGSTEAGSERWSSVGSSCIRAEEQEQDYLDSMSSSSERIQSSRCDDANGSICVEPWEEWYDAGRSISKQARAVELQTHAEMASPTTRAGSRRLVARTPLTSTPNNAQDWRRASKQRRAEDEAQRLLGEWGAHIAAKEEIVRQVWKDLRSLQKLQMNNLSKGGSAGSAVEAKSS